VQDYAIFTLDLEGRVSSWNAGAERIKGYRAEEIIGQPISRFHPEEDVRSGKPRRELEIAAREGRYEDEGWRLRKDSSRFWANVIITAIHNEAGQLIGFSKVTRDFTERREAQQRLESSYRALESLTGTLQEQAALLQLAHDAIIVRDLNSAIRFWNRGAERTYGWSKEEALGKVTHDFLQTEFSVPCEEIERALYEAGIWEGELVHRTRDGARLVIESRQALRRDDQGQPLDILEINRDITERKRAEDSLRELSGRLLRMQDDERRRIGRELHDSVGQALSVLKMNLDTLQSGGNVQGEEAKQRVGSCVHLADECIKEIRTISYLLYPPLLEEMGLKSAVPWYVEGFAKRSGIRTTLEMAPDLGRLPREVETAVFRVLQESLTNVHRHSGSLTARVHVQMNHQAITVEVQDEGKGMPPGDLQSRLEGRATLGVGLRGMNERVRQLGGRLQISSGGNGTTVTATIPREGHAIAAGNDG